MIYLIGSLRSTAIPHIRRALETSLHEEVFASWYAASENADERWREYEIGRGLTYPDALQDYAAQHIVQFDRLHLDRCRAAVLVYPAGRSGHIEFGYVLGQGKPAYVLLNGEEPRWDVMVALGNGAYETVEDLCQALTRKSST